METSLTDKTYLLEKFHGKGGWTYAQIPEIAPDKHAHFGWVRVRGFIDDYEIKAYHLMPMGNGNLFLPVKAAIRKKIKKEAGDYVRVILFEDRLPIEVPEELLLCLQDEPQLQIMFQKFSIAEQKAFVDWINSTSVVETRIYRIAQVLNKVEKGEKLHK